MSIEKIKILSDNLRGTIVESLNNPVTGSISEDDQAVIKFHGMYQQDDRDRREERAQKKLERLYSFMIRLRLPGGFLSPEQWVATHEIANKFSTGVIKITTRQTIQLHGIIKSDIKPTLQSFNLEKLDSIATCGDINRNVVVSAHPGQSAAHAEVWSYADKISALLLPKTRAYYEIWLDEEKILDKKDEEDPLYLTHYLPRKFKIAIAIAPNNDSDVFTNDIGLIAIIQNDKLQGFNIAIGGGMGSTHGNTSTYPRLANIIGFTDSEEKTLKAIYEIVTIQRDYGNRDDRKNARLKYTVDKYGLEWFKQELAKRTGFELEPEKPYTFTERHDYYNWQQNHKGLWYYTLFIENGRVLDTDDLKLKTALLEIGQTGLANYRFTCNQNLILSDIVDKKPVQEILEKYGIIKYNESVSLLRQNSMACVALNTCPLALAEGQRYLPDLVTKIEPILEKYSLDKQEISIRMTGCPNGCARPFIAEIGLVGVSSGHYNLYLGADRQGQRLNSLYKENLDEALILTELDSLFAVYASKREAKEGFGDFVRRTKVV